MPTPQTPTVVGVAAPARGPFRRIDLTTVALTILGFALAAYRLGAKSMWLDETASASHARLDLHGLWIVVSRTDPDMGLYYVLLHFWVRVFGYGEAAIRSMTVVLAGLAVPVMVLLGTRLFGRRCGLVAGLLLALSPFFVRYEQTARSYAIVVLLVLLSSYFFVVALEKPSRATLLGYVLASSLAIYSHYFAAFVLMVQFFTLLAVKRRDAFTRQWLIVAAAVIVLCAPEVVFAHRAGSGGISWISEPGLIALVHLPAQLAGETALAGVLVLLTCYGLARAVSERRAGWKTWFVAAWLVVPVILVFAASKLGHPLFVTYYLIIVLPAFMLLAAVGVVSLSKRTPTAIAVGVLVVFSALGMRNWYTRSSLEEYRGATRYILKRQRPADGIVDYPAKTTEYGIAYYETLAGAPGLTSIGFQLASGPATGPRRIWLVVRASDVTTRELHQVQSSMSGRYEQVSAPAEFVGLTVILYRLRTPPRHSGRPPSTFES